MRHIAKRVSVIAVGATAILGGLTYVVTWSLLAIGPAGFILIVAIGPGSFLFPLLQAQRYEPPLDVFLGLYVISLVAALLCWELLRAHAVVVHLLRCHLARGGFGLFVLAHFE